MQLYTYAQLSDEELTRVQSFEATTGKKALVLRHVAAEPEILSSEELGELEDLESELGYVVVIVK